MKAFTGVCATALCVLVAAASGTAAPAKPLPALAPAGSDALSRALAQGRLSEAQYALQRARSLFALGRVRREFDDVAKPAPDAATPILRDLAARFSRLSPAEQETARGILARPTDSVYFGEHRYKRGATVETTCDATRPLCFHWIEETRDAPPTKDASPANGIPDAVDRTKETFTAVWDLEVDTYGYLPPLGDGSSANDEESDDTDIYLADLGGDPTPLFGYCTTDDPHAFQASYDFFDVSAYCVVDEDFANFGSSQTRQAFRDVTAAHEFFHAIQFHYDWLEDLWLMEGTAMLMEGQFRGDVDDRIRYLDNSALTSPSMPVDRGEGGFEYGAWVHWRFLVERFGELADPLVIRRIWERAAGASVDTDGGGPDTVARDEYSLQADKHVLSDRSESFRRLFAQFARWNRNPGRAGFYDEGDSYPKAPTAAGYTLERGATTTGWHSTRLLHLSSRYYAFRPGDRTPRNASLRVSVNLPRSSHGPEASVLIHFRSGGLHTYALSLDSAGRAARTVAFGREKVRDVTLVLTNASARMRCDRGTFYSCAGVGIDDGRKFSYRAKLR